MKNLPKKLHEYDQHPVINSKRWDAYKHRPDDIIISTSYKAGTTWMQTIVANLLYQDGQFPAPVSVMSPWLGMDLLPLNDIIEGLESQTNRRFIKTHLPLDGLPYFETAKYIYVGRDGRDVFMSMWNHHTRHSDEVKGIFSQKAQALGRYFPLDFKDIHDFWQNWISHSWYDWETDGFPYWSHLHHVQSWWDYRHLDNIHFVHFADLLADPEKSVRAVAAYLNIDINESLLPAILERITFGAMKKNFTQIMPEADDVWEGGGNVFMNKGTNGRWRGVLSDGELDQYKQAVDKNLNEEAAHWLENGGSV